MTTLAPSPLASAADVLPTQGGWVDLCQPVLWNERATPIELLTRTASLPGTMRYGSPGGQEIFLLGETWSPNRYANGLELELLASMPTISDQHLPGAELVEAALETTGYAWRQREELWVIPATVQLPREIAVRTEPGGVRLEAGLMGWDELEGCEQEALALMLCRAQMGLRFARCEMRAKEALLAAHVPIEAVERQLPHSLGGVAAGVRLLAREVSALLTPELARAYLAFLGGIDEKSAHAHP